MENSNLAREKIEEKLKGVSFKGNQWLKYVIPIIVIIAFIIIAIYVFTATKADKFNYYLIGIVIVIAAGLVIGLSIYGNKINKSNARILKKVAGMDLHKIYFENTIKSASDLEYKFIGFARSSKFNNNCLTFQIGSEVVTWHVDQDIETREIGDSSETVYILKYALISSSKKLKGISGISIAQAKKFDFGKKTYLFKSESMEFNQKYKVRSRKELDAFKIFTPKVIENFVTTDLDLSENKYIWLEDNFAKIEHKNKHESLTSLVPDPLDFSKIRWGNNREKTIDDIYKKIKLDFNRYLNVQTLLTPLELYSN